MARLIPNILLLVILSLYVIIQLLITYKSRFARNDAIAHHRFSLPKTNVKPNGRLSSEFSGQNPNGMCS